MRLLVALTSSTTLVGTAALVAAAAIVPPIGARRTAREAAQQEFASQLSVDERVVARAFASQRRWTDMWLTGLARRFRTSPDVLQQLNQLTTDTINVGQRLRVPKVDVGTVPYGSRPPLRALRTLPLRVVCSTTIGHHTNGTDHAEHAEAQRPQRSTRVSMPPQYSRGLFLTM